MSKLSQKEAVFNAITEVIGRVPTEEEAALVLSANEKSSVRDILLVGFQTGTIELKSAQEDLKKYVNGLLNNWLRKDKRLNGGTTYRVQNPGSRAGQSDPMIKNLRLLKKQDGLSEEQVAEIDEAIAARLVEIKPEKAKVEIDVDAIPEALRHLV